MIDFNDDILDDIKRDEGLRLKPYRCSAGRLTIGYGRNIDDVGITHGEAAMLLDHDIRRSLAALDRALPWWRSLSESQQRGLVNMQFNLGLTRLLGFKRMLAALETGNGKLASEEALSSKWASQVGARARRVAALYRKE